jgi:hypothetical protein
MNNASKCVGCMDASHDKLDCEIASPCWGPWPKRISPQRMNTQDIDGEWIEPEEGEDD